jgi:hypothetical protein
MLRLRSVDECGDRTEYLESLSRHSKHHETVGELGNHLTGFGWHRTLTESGGDLASSDSTEQQILLRQGRVKAYGQTSWMFVLSKAGSSQDMAFCHQSGDAVNCRPQVGTCGRARLVPGYLRQ